MNLAPGIVGGLVAAGLVAWLTRRSKPTARSYNGRFVVEYRLPAKVVAWLFLGVGVFILYAASQASADQKILATCVSGALFLGILAVLLEFHFVRVEFDENFIYTFSPWRRRRVIPWNAVIDYAFSSVNKWHVLKTRGYGLIRMSTMMSGLGSMSERWQAKLERLCGTERS
jgi:hypothetical protein